VLDSLFRHQLTDLLATRLPAGARRHTCYLPAGHGRPVADGAAPRHRTPALGLRYYCDTYVSLAALAADADLSRFHFCRAFKESTGLSPHAWLAQHRSSRP
jgi:AraC family transcriptional regulator